MDIPRETAKVEISIVAASTHDNIIASIFSNQQIALANGITMVYFLEGDDQRKFSTLVIGIFAVTRET